MSARATITVASADQGRTVEFTLVQPFLGTVRGHVYAGDGVTGLPGVFVYAASPLEYGRGDETDANAGLYQITGLSTPDNTFTVTANSPTAEVFNVTSPGHAFSSEGDVQTIDLTMHVAVVHGVVTFADGRPVQGSSVVALQTDDRVATRVPSPP